MPSIEFWYDFSSPDCYPAAMRIAPLAAQEGVHVRWRPFQIEPNGSEEEQEEALTRFNPVGGSEMWRDFQLVCEADGLPVRLPPVRFPQDGRKAARLALVGRREGWTPAFTRAVFRANFGEQKDISNGMTLYNILERLGIDADPTLRISGTPEVRSILTANGIQAMARGIVRAPTFAAGPDLFVGNERLEAALAMARK